MCSNCLDFSDNCPITFIHYKCISIEIPPTPFHRPITVASLPLPHQYDFDEAGSGFLLKIGLNTILELETCNVNCIVLYYLPSYATCSVAFNIKYNVIFIRVENREHFPIHQTLFFDCIWRFGFVVAWCAHLHRKSIEYSRPTTNFAAANFSSSR